MAKACPNISLPSGFAMPAVGFGTFDNFKDDGIYEAVRVAIDCGYRLLDCACVYRSEDAAGRAIADRIQAGVVRREDLFITTKLWSTFHEPERVEQGLRESLKELGMDYVDLFLMHWPMAFLLKAGDPKVWNPDEYEPANVDFVDTWKAMEELVGKGLTKSIGVSNFNIQQLTRLLDAPLKIKPANNQVESHPWFTNQELIDFCFQKGITVTAYSPLGKGGSLYTGKKIENILEDPRFTAVADRHKKSPAQVALRWALQRGTGTVPKSCTPSRIRENFQIFDFTLSDEEMASITAMNENRRLNALEQFKDFPEYPF